MPVLPLVLLFVLVLALAGLASYGLPILLARYDRAALRAEPPPELGTVRAASAEMQRSAAWRGLARWCFEGAGDGRSPWYWPWALPRVGRRFTVAVLAGTDSAAKSHLAAAFSRELDGTVLLESLPTAGARRRLRLQVKAHDGMWWRARQTADPWDCGYLVDDAAALAGLREFMPRRATLLVAEGLAEAGVLERVEVLRARQARFRHPVRLLVLAPALPLALGAEGASVIEGPRAAA